MLIDESTENTVGAYMLERLLHKAPVLVLLQILQTKLLKNADTTPHVLSAKKKNTTRLIQLYEMLLFKHVETKTLPYTCYMLLSNAYTSQNPTACHDFFCSPPHTPSNRSCIIATSFLHLHPHTFVPQLLSHQLSLPLHR